MDLEVENQKLRDEFDSQRAKMRSLFLQKEDEVKLLTEKNGALSRELAQCQQQVVLVEMEKEKELAEMESLKIYFQDKFNESPEVDQLLHECEHLKRENIRLKRILDEHQESNSFVPALKKFAQKFGNDSNSGEASSNTCDKNNPKYDDDLDLVLPLEEEIKALKEKLRTTDEELQKYLQQNVAINQSPIHGPEPAAVCPHCTSNTDDSDAAASLSVNAEQQQQQQQQMEMLRKQVNRLQEDLERESTLRRELETEWQDKREKHKDALTQLTEALQKSEESLDHLHRHYKSLQEGIKQEISNMIQEREQMYRQIETIQKENELLAGFYLKNAEELADQEINLPNEVDALHEMLLKARQNIIDVKVGLEREQIKTVGLSEEVQLLRNQLEQASGQAREYERLIRQHGKDMAKLQKTYDKLDGHLTEAKQRIDHLELEWKKEREQTIELRTFNDKWKKINEELKMKVATLKEDLANGEVVQQDFVRLSQKLQVQLEKIRVADTQVRWLDDDEVDNCGNCQVKFTVTKRKQHCRHCGSIYCDKCLSKAVLTPSKKEARVCDVCHTLLNSFGNVCSTDL